MKILLFLFSTLFALSARDLLSTKNRTCKITCSGDTDEFTQYSNNILELEGLIRKSYERTRYKANAILDLMKTFSEFGTLWTSNY